ncbi:MAG: DUF2652 domain-containing protein [Saprospiraceae bacterium]|nr:DUF2652 domain-containing protein [Saprospiraceae bacterium]
MSKSLLFLPDISGFTNFVQTTEVEHSQHVISELLEVLIGANTQDLQLAEIEGDALFFYKEEEIPSLEKLLAQIETMFTAFHSHLKLLEKNRVCPCNACSSAPNLQLKIVAHSGELQFINVQDNRKPFGAQVIEVHRLMKNSVPSDNYVLLSQDLADDIELFLPYKSKLYEFQKGQNVYDSKLVKYLYATVDNNQLKIKPFAQAKKVNFERSPSLYFKEQFPISAKELLEYITNYKYRHEWVEGVEKFEYNEKEVTRLGTEHICVIDGKHLNFITVTKKGKPGQLVYGELTTSPPPVDALYQFFIISPMTKDTCTLEIEVYWTAKSLFKKLMLILVVQHILKKNIKRSLELLLRFITE